MSSSKFPLCESLGLTVREVNFDWKFDFGKTDKTELCYIDASDVESLLAKGVRVYFGKDSCGVQEDAITITSPEAHFDLDTHTALLIDVRPIEKLERRRELSESQVREALLEHRKVLNNDDIIDRLFGKKDGG